MAAAFSSSTAIAQMAVEGAPAWDLATLMPDGAVGASASGGRAVMLAQEFAEQHRGRIGGYDATELASLGADLERVQEALTVSYAYSMLRFDADSGPPEHGAQFAESDELMACVETLVTFVELEWIALDDARAEELLADPALGRFAHWLGGVRRSRPHRLSEPEKRILAEKTVTGAGSWRRLLDAQVATLGVATGDALDNQASDASVAALVDAVVARYDIPRRWSELKARALGLERLADFERFAPVGGPPSRVSWEQARELVVSSSAAFSPRWGRDARRFFDERWMDRRPAGHDAGAYCASTTPNVHAYALINFSGRLEDVLTLAHFAHLLDVGEDPAIRFQLLARRRDEAVATVFRQVAIHRLEDVVHRARRDHGELSVPRPDEHWMAVNRALYGDPLEPTDGLASWWSYVSHVFDVPSYGYASAYGQLLALAIYARYEKQGEAFVDSYLALLAAGGSRSPQPLGEMVGVDRSDPGFWAIGLELIDRHLDEARDVAAATTA